VLGATMGFLLMVFVFNVFRRASPRRVDRVFRPGQLLSSALLSLAHGSNDAQKTMGIVVGLLASPAAQAVFRDERGPLRFLYLRDTSGVPLWVEVMAYLAISLGTLFGGWRIVHTMGSRITRLRPVGGFCAETGGGAIILVASHFGIPVSTTHTITGSIVGVGATNRLSAVRWGLAGRIVWAWILTIPASAPGGRALLLDPAHPRPRLTGTATRDQPPAADRALHQPRAFLARVQRARAARGARRARAAARAAEVPLDLQHQPGRVLHGPGGGLRRKGAQGPRSIPPDGLSRASS
jgi:hypothetical protein